MKRLMTIGLIFVCHAAAFVAIYFGRVKDMAMCGSDITLFVIPFVAAVAAYAAVFARIIKVQRVWTRGLLVMVASVLTGVFSTEIGMTIAFNLLGT